MPKRVCDRPPDAPKREKLGRKPKVTKDVTSATVRRLTREVEHLPRSTKVELVQPQDTTLAALLELFNSPTPDLDKYEDVEAAVVNYFQWVDRVHAMPSYASLALALHIDRRTFIDWEEGVTRAYDPRYSRLVKSCNAVITAYTEQAGASGEIQPVFAMFLLNNSRQGYVQSNKIEVSVPQPEQIQAPNVDDVLDIYAASDVQQGRE